MSNNIAAAVPATTIFPVPDMGIEGLVFTGQRVVSGKDNKTFIEDTASLIVGGSEVFICLRRDITNPCQPPKLAQIARADGKLVWSYGNERAYWAPLVEGQAPVCRLALAYGHPLLAILFYNRGHFVEQVIPIVDIVGGNVDKSVFPAQALFDFKVGVAELFGITYRFTAEESAMQQARFAAAERQKRLAETRARIAAQAAKPAPVVTVASKETVTEKEAQRDALRSQIAARAFVVGFGPDGRRYEATPITKGEVSSLLPGKKSYIIVDQFDDAGNPGVPQELVRLSKAKGQPTVTKTVAVLTVEAPVKSAGSAMPNGESGSALPKPLGHQIVQFGNGMRVSVTLFASTTDAALHRDADAIKLGWYAAYNSKNDLELYHADGNTVARAEYEFVETDAATKKAA